MKGGSKSILDRPFHLFGITFAPINTSLDRRLQTFGVLFILWWWLFSVLTLVYVGYRLLWLDYYRWLPLLYLTFVAYDSNTAFTGGRLWPSCRGWKVWRWSRDYFPINLVKTEDLDPTKNYVLGSHPHGILCFGSFVTFCTNASRGEWDRLFPGLKRRLVALNLMFYLPGLREIALSCGAIAASSDSIRHVLRQKGSGLTSIMVGGAKESLCVPDGNKISVILRNRRGFVRLALEEGADLVPSFTFGEQHCYSIVRNPEGSRLRAFQEKWKKWLTFSPVLFYGRGIFQYSFGLLPRRHPITVVIGSPISLSKVSNPTSEMVDKIHNQYMDALRNLYDKHNPTYGDPSVKLEII